MKLEAPRWVGGATPKRTSACSKSPGNCAYQLPCEWDEKVFWSAASRRRPGALSLARPTRQLAGPSRCVASCVTDVEPLAPRHNPGKHGEAGLSTGGGSTASCMRSPQPSDDLDLDANRHTTPPKPPKPPPRQRNGRRGRLTTNYSVVASHYAYSRA